MLLGRDLDYDDKQLRDYLVETCFFRRERFPEYEEWCVASARMSTRVDMWGQAYSSSPFGVGSFFAGG
jgi:hypothetical protein